MQPLTIPSPQLVLDPPGGPAALEKPVTVQLGPIAYPDAQAVAQAEVKKAGAFVYRGPIGGEELWDDGAKQWKPAPADQAALADLSPLPTTARVGQWLTLDGTMLVPATGAKVVLLGPRGAPKAVTASLSGDRVHSSFAVDQPGGFLVQVLATVSTGPRPARAPRRAPRTTTTACCA